MSQSETFMKISTQMNIQIYLYENNYANESPNIFVQKILHEQMSE